MGAFPFIKHWNIGTEGFQALEESGYEVISTGICDGTRLQEFSFSPKNVLIIGNEAHGISKEIKNRSVCPISIPMSGNIESLNAGVAGSICMCAMGTY